MQRGNLGMRLSLLLLCLLFCAAALAAVFPLIPAPWFRLQEGDLAVGAGRGRRLRHKRPAFPWLSGSGNVNTANSEMQGGESLGLFLQLLLLRNLRPILMPISSPQADGRCLWS